jgi:hypothetical protein
MKACLRVMVSLFVAMAVVPRYCAAQHTHTKFTPSSAVYQIDDTTWGVGAEVVLAPPDPGTTVTDADLHFKLPEGGTITKLQATISFAFPWGPTQNTCPQPGEALGIFIIDGKRFAPIIQKLNSSSSAGSREITTFVSYDIPLRYSSGKGILHVEANPFGCWSNWEIQGMLSVSFDNK